ncbi:MAG: phosphoenolpyruvate synthase [Solirubrobacterales bacterium]|nr:phosphoenolpyruvate synthase [Solirubrobacterales bacterium]
MGPEPRRRGSAPASACASTARRGWSRSSAATTATPPRGEDGGVAGAHTRPLADLRRADEPHFGAKSANLGELSAAEIPVPPGFALSRDAYLVAAEDLGLEGRSAEEASRAIRAAPLSAALRAELDAGYEELVAAAGDPRPPVAVRSSAIGEDTEDATFAGQHETRLWVRGIESVDEAVRECWASLHGPEAVSYRAELASAAGAPAMGVAIQLMIDATVSGVMFTCNPVSGDPSTVAIEASWGLGLAVVAGEVTPDEYRVSKVTREVLSRRLGPKELEYVPGAGETGTARVEVSPERRRAECLDEEQLARLVDLARRVERHFGGHQDIEWAIARGSDEPGELFLLQSRPVTATPSRPKPTGAQRSAIDLVMGTFGASGGGERP